MAIRDISFYKYLEAAFRYRLFNPQGARATLDTRFNYLGYNLSFGRIFYYARRILPKFYTNAFPDTEEGNLQMARTVLQKLDQHQDLELDRYFDPATAPEENVPVIEEAAKESVAQQPPAASTTAGALPGVAMRPPSMPRLPSVKLGTTPEQPETTQKTSEPAGPTLKRGFNLSRFRPPAPFINTAKNFGSAAGRFFQRNIGKFFTVGRIATVVSSGIGAVVGAGLTNSSPAGIFGGAGLGAITPSWIRSGGGAKFLGQIGNGAINFGANLSNQVSSGATRLSMSSGSKKLLWALLGAFILFFGISLFGGLTGTTPPGQAGPLPPPVGGGGDIGNCTFYRGADNPVGLKFRISEWPALINEVATKVGIPATVVAGVLRVESGTPFYTDNPDYMKNDYDAHTNGLVYGVMQFYPPTFEGIFNRHQSELAQLFGKTSVTTQIVPQDQMAPTSVFRIYSIRDQIIAATFKIKDDAGANPPYNREAIERIVTAYFGQCPYTANGNTYNYCDDVWTSIQNCQVQPGIPPGPALSTILAWDQRIVDSLSVGLEGRFNALLTAISNNNYSTGTWAGANEGSVYWCTYSIIDAYNLAGVPGLSKGAHAAVIVMRRFWSQSSEQGYKFLDYQNDNTLLKVVQPGYAIFMELVPGFYTGREHVALIKTISLDARGNGTIETNDSNSGQQSNLYRVIGWNITNTPYTVTGLGGI